MLLNAFRSIQSKHICLPNICKFAFELSENELNGALRKLRDTYFRYVSSNTLTVRLRYCVNLLSVLYREGWGQHNVQPDTARFIGEVSQGKF